MYIIISRKKPSGISRGHKQENNYCVNTVSGNLASFEQQLEEKLNEIAAEGTRDEREIIQVLWRD